jgi:hypothetical protein
MKMGFTGTRTGMTAHQMRAVQQAMERYGPVAFHHGDCEGADAEAHIIAMRLGIRIVIHPPVDDKHRAFCKGEHEMREPKTHFARNRDIVNETQLLIATPWSTGELDYGGTWYTINYGRKQKAPVIIVWPDGSQLREGFP